MGLEAKATYYACLVICLLAYYPTALGWRAFKVIFTQFPYQANPNYIDTKIHIDNDTENALNVVINVLETLDNISMTGVILLENNVGKYTTLLNSTLNFCKFLKQKSSESLVRLIYDDIARHGNWFKQCPIAKGHYTLQKYTIDEEMLPSYLPETNFLISITLKTAKGVQIFKGELTAKIDKSKGFNNLKMFSMG